MLWPPPRYTLFPYTTLFRSPRRTVHIASDLYMAEAASRAAGSLRAARESRAGPQRLVPCARRRRESQGERLRRRRETAQSGGQDRKSTRLNSSHANISYAVF